MKQTLMIFAAVLATASLASAHSKTEKATPANDATVQSVDMIEMRFDDPMRVTAISMTGPEGAVELTRETGLDPVTEFRALPPEAMPAGTYTVEWRGLAADGHPMQGTFGFTIAD